ncbi:MAG: hypothetical protein IID05_03245, partial [Gemmatimonadetes bacterium]|nr:hypothetical protein [Gemmatimonadota bacterium]
MTNSDSVVDVERSLLAGVSTDVGWRLIERFSTLVRESGMADEHAGADYIVDELSRMGIDHEVHEPELFLSLPRAASVSWNGRECRAKPPAFAVPTPSEGVVAPGVYLPVPPMRDLGEIFDDKHAAGGGEPPVRGKIVVTNGYAMPSVVQRFERAGAVAQVYRLLRRPDSLNPSGRDASAERGQRTPYCLQTSQPLHLGRSSDN